MELKAVELLREYRSIDFGCDMSGLHSEIDVSIQELEQLENRSCLTCKNVFDCKLAEDIKTTFGLKLKEQCFFCWEGK